MSVNMKKSTENKKETSINYENVYLYIQIVISIIFVLISSDKTSGRTSGRKLFVSIKKNIKIS